MWESSQRRSPLSLTPSFPFSQSRRRAAWKSLESVLRSETLSGQCAAEAGRDLIRNNCVSQAAAYDG